MNTQKYHEKKAMDKDNDHEINTIQNCRVKKDGCRPPYTVSTRHYVCPVL